MEMKEMTVQILYSKVQSKYRKNQNLNHTLYSYGFRHE